MRCVSRRGDLERFRDRHGRALIVLGDEAAMDMAGPDPDFEHHRRVGRFRQFEAVLYRLDDASRLGLGSSSQICDFIAKEWLRSCMMEEPSP